MITILAGENDAMRAAELARLVSAFEVEHGDMAIERLDGEEASYERMLEAVQSLPFLVPKKLIVLRKPSTCKEFTEKFEAFLGEVAETNDVIISEGKLDKRLAYYKELKKLKGFKEFNILDANGLIRFVQGYAAEQGGKLSSSDARFLVERAGLNQMLLQNEVDKLLLKGETIARKDIEELVEKTPQSSVFDLLEAAFRGDKKRVAVLYAEQKALKVEPQQIIALLVWQLHQLTLIKMAGNRTPEDIAREAKLSPYSVKKAAGLVQSMPLARLKELVSSLREIDVRTKSDGTSADEAVQYYLLSISS